MTKPPRIFVQDLLPEHFEEIEFLLGQWQAALRSPTQMQHDARTLEDRITAHVDGLRVWPNKAIAVVEPGLSGEASTAFASGFVLLCLGDDNAAKKAIAALLKAEGEALDGLRRAFCQAPVNRVEDQLRELLTSAPALTAITCAEALAYHGRLDVKHPRLPDFFRDENAAVRRAAWRLAAVLGPTATK